MFGRHPKAQCITPTALSEVLNAFWLRLLQVLHGHFPVCSGCAWKHWTEPSNAAFKCCSAPESALKRCWVSGVGPGEAQCAFGHCRAPS
eukprot:2037817-Alexandrium_andersonii.AAC.1